MAARRRDEVLELRIHGSGRVWWCLSEVGGGVLVAMHLPDLRCCMRPWLHVGGLDLGPCGPGAKREVLRKAESGVGSSYGSQDVGGMVIARCYGLLWRPTPRRLVLPVRPRRQQWPGALGPPQDLDLVGPEGLGPWLQRAW